METMIAKEILLLATFIAFFVSGVVEMYKRTFPKKYKKNWIPVISFFAGLLIGALSYPFTDADLVIRLWAGAIGGWMSSGIYETIKRVPKA